MSALISVAFLKFPSCTPVRGATRADPYFLPDSHSPPGVPTRHLKAERKISKFLEPDPFPLATWKNTALDGPPLRRAAKFLPSVESTRIFLRRTRHMSALASVVFLKFPNCMPDWGATRAESRYFLWL